MSLYRLRTDFQFAIITLFGVVGVLGILPFAIYRFSSGQPLAGAIDAALVLCVAMTVVYIWRGGDLERAGLVVVVTTTAGCVLIATLLGLAGVLWMYPVLLANFLVVSRGRALAASLAAIGFLVLHGQAFDTVHQRMIFLVTASVVSLFSWIFAHRAASQRAQLEALATCDPLTGANNRRAMEHDLLLAIEAHRRHRVPFGLLLLDLDHFKRINDNHGHEAGDEALVAFTGILQRAMRKLDRLYRIGGEEFVVLLRGAAERDLAAISETLRATVAVELRSRGEPVTVSIGAAALRPGEAPATWLGRADQAAYQAKLGGRNRVVVDGSAHAPAHGVGMEPGETSLGQHWGTAQAPPSERSGSIPPG